MPDKVKDELCPCCGNDDDWCKCDIYELKKYIRKLQSRPKAIEWEKEFDDKFCQKGGLSDWKFTIDIDHEEGIEQIEVNMAVEIKSFIRNLLNQEER